MSKDDYVYTEEHRAQNEISASTLISYGKKMETIGKNKNNRPLQIAGIAVKNIGALLGEKQCPNTGWMSLLMIKQFSVQALRMDKAHDAISINRQKVLEKMKEKEHPDPISQINVADFFAQHQINYQAPEDKSF